MKEGPTITQLTHMSRAHAPLNELLPFPLQRRSQSFWLLSRWSPTPSSWPWSSLFCLVVLWQAFGSSLISGQAFLTLMLFLVWIRQWDLKLQGVIHKSRNPNDFIDPPLSRSYELCLMHFCRTITNPPPPTYVTSFMNAPHAVLQNLCKNKKLFKVRIWTYPV